MNITKKKKKKIDIVIENLMLIYTHITEYHHCYLMSDVKSSRDQLKPGYLL